MIFAAAPDTHAMRGRRLALCGQPIDPRDLYEDEGAGQRIWTEFPQDRCFQCEAQLALEGEGIAA